MDENEPCKLCEQAELPCGQKLWGPKTENKLWDERHVGEESGQSILYLERPISRPQEEIVTEFDDIYIQFFLEKRCPSAMSGLLVAGKMVGWVIVPEERSYLLASSQALRCAASAMASIFKGGNHSTMHTIAYLVRCYQHTHKALSSTPSVDLLYVCYILFRLAIFMHEPTESILFYLSTMHKIRHYLKHRQTELRGSELEWIEALWLDALINMYHRLSSDVCQLSLQSAEGFARHIEKIYNMLDDPPSSDGRVTGDLLPSQLMVYMFYSFMYFMLSAFQIPELEPPVRRITAPINSLNSIAACLTTFYVDENPRFFELLQKLTSFILSHEFANHDSRHDTMLGSVSPLDLGCLLLSGYAMYVQGIVAIQEHNNNAMACFSATFLCNVVILLQRELPINKSNDSMAATLLVFAGLVLTNEYFPLGNIYHYCADCLENAWIKTVLRSIYERNSELSRKENHRCSSIWDLLPNFLEDDISSQEAAGLPMKKRVCLWQYTLLCSIDMYSFFSFFMVPMEGRSIHFSEELGGYISPSL